jgi:hypothetical protein
MGKMKCKIEATRFLFVMVYNLGSQQHIHWVLCDTVIGVVAVDTTVPLDLVLHYNLCKLIPNIKDFSVFLDTISHLCLYSTLVYVYNHPQVSSLGTIS